MSPKFCGEKMFCNQSLSFKRKKKYAIVTDSVYWLISPQNMNRTNDGQHNQIFGWEIKTDTGNYVSTWK